MQKDKLLEFLKSQKLLVIATQDENSPWICSVYYSINNNFEIFYVSSPKTNHSKHIEKNAEVAFSISWYNENDLTDRKAVQGKGKCEFLTDENKIKELLENHHKYYSLWKEVITFDAIKNGAIESKPYIIRPSYMKFWNDKLYGPEGLEEFNF